MGWLDDLNQNTTFIYSSVFEGEEEKVSGTRDALSEFFKCPVLGDPGESLVDPETGLTFTYCGFEPNTLNPSFLNKNITSPK
jgi:hypothetical protein